MKDIYISSQTEKHPPLKLSLCKNYRIFIKIRETVARKRDNSINAEDSSLVRYIYMYIILYIYIYIMSAYVCVCVVAI